MIEETRYHSERRQLFALRLRQSGWITICNNGEQASFRVEEVTFNDRSDRLYITVNGKPLNESAYRTFVVREANIRQNGLSAIWYANGDEAHEVFTDLAR